MKATNAPIRWEQSPNNFPIYYVARNDGDEEYRWKSSYYMRIEYYLDEKKWMIHILNGFRAKWAEGTIHDSARIKIEAMQFLADTLVETKRETEKNFELTASVTNG